MNSQQHQNQQVQNDQYSNLNPKEKPDTPGRDPIRNPDPNPSQFPENHPDELPNQDPNEIPDVKYLHGKQTITRRDGQ